MKVRRVVFVASALLIGVVHPAGAQRPDVIQGRVIARDSSPVADAVVTATDTVSKTVRPARTDATGAFSLTIAGGSGIYMVAVQRLGYGQQRRLVVRPASDSAIAPQIFRLVPAATTLGAVRSVGERPKTLRSDINGEYTPGSQNKDQRLANGLGGDFSGDLNNAMIGIAGVTYIPDPFGGPPQVSAFGVTGDQNQTVLNGMGFGGSVPRDGARLNIVTSTYDPSRGGFAGVQQSLGLRPGSDIETRSIHGTLNAPSLEWTSPVASQLGTTYTQGFLSGVVAGPLVLDRLFYSTSYQYQRLTRDLTSLASAGPEALQGIHLSPDSVSSLFNTALPLSGIPTTTPGLPNDRLYSDFRVAERIDLNPNPPTSNSTVGVIVMNGVPYTLTTDDAYYMQFGGDWNGNQGLGIGTTSLAASGSQSAHRDGWWQFTSAKYLPQNILNETTVSASGSENSGSPYLDLPSARVLLASALADGTVGLTNIQVGGASSARSDSKNWATELRNETSWNTWDRRHSIKLTLDGTHDGYWYRQDAGYGTYTYNSLSDLELNTPSSFSRTLTPTQGSGQGYSGAIGLSDTYNAGASGASFVPIGTPQPVRPVIIYGLRLEGNHLGIEPAYNPAVDSLFGRRTDHVPSTAAISPMVGFNMAMLPQMTNAQGFPLGRRGFLSGGIREYRGSIAARTVDSYAHQTGLLDAVQSLYCVGSAVPTPQWSAYQQSLDSLPTQCANGSAGTPLAQTAPNVSLYAPNYQLYESWRSALSFRYSVTSSLSLTTSGNYARNTSQTFADVNFKDSAQFALSAEGNRPVFVAPSDIVSASGVPAWSASRVSPQFAHVSETLSDLHADVPTLGENLSYFLNVGRDYASVDFGYNYTDAREQVRGFSASTGGDPTQVFWSRGSQPKHSLYLTLNYTRPDRGNIWLFTRVQSGVPYTPMVAGDINGDGYYNNRAFVFDAASPKTDSVVASEMKALLATAPSSATNCLLRQIGAVASRNSCTAPWGVNAFNLRLDPDPYWFGFRNRGNISIQFSNLLSGLDQLLHGSNNLQGWGTPAVPDQTLLTVRGFNPATNNFMYTVNPQFGSTSVYRNLYRPPFTITIDASIQVEPDRESQYLFNALKPRGRAAADEMTLAQIKNKIANNNNPLDRMLPVMDSLHLDAAQTERVRAIARRLGTTRDSIVSTTAAFLYARHGDYAGDEVRERWHGAALATYSAYIHALRDVVAVLTPEQAERSKHVPQLAGLVTQVATMKDADLAKLFRGPMSSLP